MAEYAWVWSPGTWPPLLEPATSEWFWIPDGYSNGPTDGRLSAAVSGLLTEWETTPAPDLDGDPPLYAWLHALRPPEKLPRPHILSMPLRYGHHTGVGDLLRLEVTSRWPAGSLVILDDMREELGRAMGCSDIPAEFWSFSPEDDFGPEPSFCPSCGGFGRRGQTHAGAHRGFVCEPCFRVVWTRREAVVASVDVDLRPRARVRPLPGTVTIGGREFPARVVEVTYEHSWGDPARATPIADIRALQRDVRRRSRGLDDLYGAGFDPRRFINPDSITDEPPGEGRYTEAEADAITDQTNREVGDDLDDPHRG